MMSALIVAPRFPYPLDRGNPLVFNHAWIDSSADYSNGIGKSLTNAKICYDRVHVLVQLSNLKSACVWRRKQALRLVYPNATASSSERIEQGAMSKLPGWARRRSLEPFKRLARTLKACFGGFANDMLDGRSKTYFEAMKRPASADKAAVRGFHNVENFIATASLRMSRIKHLP